MAKTKYKAPKETITRAGGAPATVAVLLVIALFATLIWVLLVHEGSRDELVFDVFVVASIIGLVGWLGRLTNFRQKAIDNQHRYDYYDQNSQWVDETVIPFFRKTASIELSHNEATELMYSGSLQKVLGEPYPAHNSYVIQITLEDDDEIEFSLNRVTEQYTTDAVTTETTAIPLALKPAAVSPKKKRYTWRS